jgi:spore germination protein GerM
MRPVAVLASLFLVLTGCGVPIQSEPVPIASAAVPTRLQGSPGAPTVAPSATPGRPAVQVNFVRDDKLVPLLRDTPASTPASRLAAVVDALLAGPSEKEQATGITTALPPGIGLTVVDVQGSRVDLQLSGETDGRSATENVLAVGQMVLSVTALPTVDQVSFSRDGTPVEALMADGALTAEPLTAADYEALRAR